MEKTINSFDGAKIYYRYYPGKEPTLVFLHGVGGNWTVWRNELEYFQKKGYSTLTLDLRGHGLSSIPEDISNYRLYYFSRDIYNILNTEKIKNFSLIGHSFGGGVAINYCMRYKKKSPSSLILVETASTYPFDHNRLLNHGPYLTQFLRFIAEHKLTRKEHFFHFDDVDLSVKGITENFHLISHLLHLTPLRSIVRALDNLERFVFKNQRRIDETLKHYCGPILLIAGGKDQVVPLKYSKIIRDLNEKAELKIIKDAHHKVMIEKPKAIERVIENFIHRTFRVS